MRQRLTPGHQCAHMYEQAQASQRADRGCALQPSETWACSWMTLTPAADEPLLKRIGSLDGMCQPRIQPSPYPLPHTHTHRARPLAQCGQVRPYLCHERVVQQPQRAARLFPHPNPAHPTPPHPGAWKPSRTCVLSESYGRSGPLSTTGGAALPMRPRREPRLGSGPAPCSDVGSA